MLLCLTGSQNVTVIITLEEYVTFLKNPALCVAVLLNCFRVPAGKLGRT